MCGAFSAHIYNRLWGRWETGSQKGFMNFIRTVISLKLRDIFLCVLLHPTAARDRRMRSTSWLLILGEKNR